MPKKASSAEKRRAAKRKAARARQRRILTAVGAVALVVVLAVILVHITGENRHDVTVAANVSETAVPTSTPEATPEPTQPDTPEPTPSPTDTLTPEPTAVPDPTATPRPVKLDYPYAIIVDRGAQVVTILTVGETGKYDVIARQMICSTDKYDRKPTNGVYKLDGQRREWMSTLTGSYVQYATRISGTILFHSLPYTSEDPSKLMADEYKKLGKNVSEGCVRLTCEDAKWIYENVPDNTLVWFRTGEYDADFLKTLLPPVPLSGKWDPTDDNPANLDYIGGSYHLHPVATPYPGVTPAPTSYPIRTWD